jgi:hypothetical protein
VLRVLHVTGLRNADVDMFAAAMATARTLHCSCAAASCSCVTDAHAVSLAVAVSACPSLRRLSLAGNRIGDEGAAALVAALPGSAVEESDFRRNNRVGDAGNDALMAVAGRRDVAPTSNGRRPYLLLRSAA